MPLCACAAVLGIDDGTPRASGAGDSGPIITPPTLPDGAPVAIGCEDPAGTTDGTTGVFVAPSGADAPACGTQAAPCRSIQAGIDRAHDSGHPNVYVADGAYVEALTLKAGVHVRGGWKADWSRDCDQTKTTVLAPATASVTVRADGVSDAALSTLLIESKLDNDVAAGESVYGIMATGTTNLALVWVTVQMHDGGAGASGAVGDAGASGGSGCSAGDGAASTVTGTAGGGADSGVYGPAGFASTAGGTGGPGGTGENGTAGGDGGCVTCVQCPTSLLVPCTGSPSGNPSCGSAGHAGCGGRGGAGGPGGAGGGSSVALYVWDATVRVTACTLNAGNGGNGGAGGPGGPGGPGTPGTGGGPGSECVVSCSGVAGASCSADPSSAGSAGKAGGPGGSGASGGVGGDGAGGDSYAYVEGGSATVTIDTTTLTSGLNPGRGGTSPKGAPGKSGPKGP